MTASHRSITCLRGACLAVLGAALLWAAGPARGQTGSSGEAPRQSDPAPRLPEKKIAFAMDGKPWKLVFTWLTEVTDKPVIANHLPQGTLTFHAPPGATYTLPEIIDLINYGLLSNSATQKYYLVHGEQAFTLVPADEKIDPALLPRVLVEDLEKRGKTELVSVVMPLKSLVAEDVAPEVKKMMGPFGDVVPMITANQLILQDTVGNLRRIVKTIHSIEGGDGGGVESFSHECMWIKASKAEAILKQLMGDPAAMMQAALAQQQQGNPWDRDRRPPTPAPTEKVRMHYITSDPRTNSVLVTGPADKIAMARDIMKRIDVQQPGQQRVLGGPPQIKTYPVPTGNAEAIARVLQEAYQGSPSVRISSAGTGTILVLAGPEDQIAIAQQIIGNTDQGVRTEVVPVAGLDPAKTAEMLKLMYGGGTTGAPFIDAQADQGAIVVRGTTEQVMDVKASVKALTAGGFDGGTGSMRIITLDKGSAATLAEALERILSQTRKNPVEIISPDRRPPVPPAAPRMKRADDPTGSSPGDVAHYEPVAQGPLVDPKGEAQPREDGRPGVAEKPIRITAFGNRLIISSEDPEALAMAQALVRLLTETPPGEGDFEVIRLKYALATEAAKVLDEAFNGTRPQQSSRGGPPNPASFFGRFSRDSTPQTPTTPQENRIRVVADPQTNSLIVRASPLDMLTIRRLLERAIDTGEASPTATMKPWTITLKYANATEVANVIKELYRESLNNNVPPTQLGSMRGFSSRLLASQNQNVDAQGNPRPITLAVSADERTNTLFLNCSEPLYQELMRLVEEMELAAKDSTRTVKIVPIQGIDPTLVQQAIDAIQGRPTATQPLGPSRSTPSPSSSPMIFPSGGVPGGFPGGFQRGGFQRGGDRGDRGGGRRSSSGFRPQSRGPDFFAQGVKDDPKPAPFFDPHHVAPGHTSTPDGVHLTSYQQPAPPGGQPAPSEVQGPRLNVTAQPLPQAGAIVISGSNAADVEAVIKIIETLRQVAKAGDIQVQLTFLERADATSVANTLTELFRRVIVGPSGNVLGTAPTQQPGLVPGATQGVRELTEQALASVVLLPVPRLNAIFIAAPQARMEDVLKRVKELDRETARDSQLTPFRLRKASAARVANQVSQLYAQRYPGELANQHQIRVTYDESSNTVFVQAAPADLADIRQLIQMIDNTVSGAVSDVRVVTLRNALADELAALLLQALSDAIAPTTGTGSVPAVGTTTPGLPGGAGQIGQQGGLGALGQQAPGALGQQAGRLGQGATLPGGAGQPGALGQQGRQGAGQATATSTLTTKTTTLRFIGSSRDGKPILESGLLEDIHILPDVRTNSLILVAPEKTMSLLMLMINELDVPPAARAEINIFQLKKSDAAATASMLQQLFLGAGQQGAGAQQQPGAPGGITGQQGGLFGQFRPLQLSVGPTPPEGAPLIDLRIAVDPRTNSILVAGSRNDLLVIEAIIARLEDAQAVDRRHEVYQLRNATAADVANALNTFLSSSLAVLQRNQQLAPLADVFAREVVVVPEPITNKLLISATPRYFDEVLRLITQLDAESPQVVLQVLIAQVNLTGSEEFGVEIGLQSPVLFQRSIIPATGLLGNGSISYANATGGLVPPGVTVNSTINPAAQPGFNFNNPALPLGNNPLVDPGVVGFQGLGSLGVGRVNPSGLGGFVFSAASESFNLLIRALKTQGRIDILSRPQVMTLDNQSARVFVGQDFPIILGSNVTATGIVNNNIQYRPVGVELLVTPKITPDGRVIMRVTPQVSSTSPTNVSLGNGIFATAINQQLVDTTVVAQDGETVAIGGLITKRDQKNENKIPWLGDLPGIGTLFRYRTQTKEKQELLVILTPHVVRTRAEAERILAEETQRMDWLIGDVTKLHGTSGMGPVLAPEHYLPPVPPEEAAPHPFSPEVAIPPGTPLPVPEGAVLPPPQLVPEAQPVLPPPHPVSGPQTQLGPQAPPAGQVPAAQPVGAPVLPPVAPVAGPQTQAGPPAQPVGQVAAAQPGAAGAATPPSGAYRQAIPAPAPAQQAVSWQTPVRPGVPPAVPVVSAPATPAPAPEGSGAKPVEEGKESSKWRFFRKPW